jgi:hypothetical protein
MSPDKPVEMTLHASRRVEDRISISEEEVKKMISEEKCVTLYKEEGTDIYHHLFFSHLDNQCFVAVVNNHDGRVITILPLHFHQKYNFRGRISEEACQMAMQLSGHYTPPEKLSETLDEVIEEIRIPSNPPPSVFRIMVWGYQPRGEHKIFNLGSCPVNKEIDGSKLLKDSSFCKEILRRLEEKYPGTKLSSMVITYGKNEKRKVWSKDFNDFDDEKRWEEFFKESKN